MNSPDTEKALDDTLGGMSVEELGRVYRVLQLFASEAGDWGGVMESAAASMPAIAASNLTHSVAWPPDVLIEAATQVHEVMRNKGFDGDPVETFVPECGA
jgi:hypothetical protein